jgi:hypothetical protein
VIVESRRSIVAFVRQREIARGCTCPNPRIVQPADDTVRVHHDAACPFVAELDAITP